MFTDKTLIAPLAKKVVESNYPENTIRQLGGIDPFTIKRWADGVSTPRYVSLKALCKIMSVTEESLRQYCNREIDLETLWSRVGESTAIETATPNSYSHVLYLAKTLPNNDRLKLAQELIGSYTSIPQTTNITLSSQNKTRLKTLVTESLRYRQSNVNFLSEKGVNELFISDVLSQFAQEYPLSYYEPLAPLIYRAREWINDNLVILDYPNTYQCWDELVKDLGD